MCWPGSKLGNECVLCEGPPLSEVSYRSPHSGEGWYLGGPQWVRSAGPAPSAGLSLAFLPDGGGRRRLLEPICLGSGGGRV